MCFNLSTEKHESLKEYLLAMVQGRLQYDEFYALRDVSLDIMPGDFYGLVGLNGSANPPCSDHCGRVQAQQGQSDRQRHHRPPHRAGCGLRHGLDRPGEHLPQRYGSGLLAQVSGREVRRDRGVQRAAELPRCAAENYSSGMWPCIGLPLPPSPSLTSSSPTRCWRWATSSSSRSAKADEGADGRRHHGDPGVPLHRADRAHVQQGGMAEPRPPQDERRHRDRLQRLQGCAAGRGIRNYECTTQTRRKS